MSITIKISDTVRFPVEGKLRGADGVERDFAFELVMDRMDQDKFDATLLDPSTKTKELVTSLARGWYGVSAEDGGDVAFSKEALERLLQIPGLTTTAWIAYCKHAGVQAKNSERSSA